jgi:bacterioferritin-associated ferredoxin
VIDRCICHEVPFEEALELAEAEGCETVEDLRERIDICGSCRMCLPYLRKALETGQTEFET